MRFATLALVALVALFALLIFSPQAVARREQANAHRAYLQALERQEAAQRRELETATLPYRYVFWSVFAAVSACIVVGGAGAMLWQWHRRNLALVRLDGAGRAPLRLDDAYSDHAAAAAQAYHLAQQLQAQIQPVPHTLHYAPAPRTTVSSGLLPGDSTPAEASDPALPAVTDLAQLNVAPALNRILLGLGPGGEQISVPLRDLWHIGTAGPTGAGKTNIARLVLAQLLTLEARVCIADPKWTPLDVESGEDWRPIARRLYREPAATADAIEQLIIWSSTELEQRLERRKNQQPVGPPLFLYLDEFTTIAAEVRDAEKQIARLARMGRGVRIFLLMAAHNFLVKSGAGDTRDQMRTCYYLGGDLKTGSVLLDLPQRELAQREDQLTTGVALLRSQATRRATFIRVPYASNAALYRLLGEAPPSTEMVNEGATEAQSSASAAARAEPLTEREALILSLVQQRRGMSEIVEKVYGAKGGPKYRERAGEVMDVIARHIQA